MVFSGRD